VGVEIVYRHLGRTIDHALRTAAGASVGFHYGETADDQ